MAALHYAAIDALRAHLNGANRHHAAGR
jgi:hypothetical protein